MLETRALYVSEGRSVSRAQAGAVPSSARGSGLDAPRSQGAGSGACITAPKSSGRAPTCPACHVRRALKRFLSAVPCHKLLLMGDLKVVSISRVHGPTQGILALDPTIHVDMWTESESLREAPLIRILTTMDQSSARPLVTEGSRRGLVETGSGAGEPGVARCQWQVARPVVGNVCRHVP